MTFSYQAIDLNCCFSVQWLARSACLFVDNRITLSAQQQTRLLEGNPNSMSWIKPGLKNSIYGLLGNPVAPSESVLESSTEDIRESMLASLGDTGPKHFPQV